MIAASALESRLALGAEARSDALLRDLERFVAIPTGHGHRPGLDELGGLMRERLESLGGAAREIAGDPRPAWLALPGDTAPAGAPPPTMVVERRGRGPRILISGHLDTVHDPRGAFRELSIAPGGRTATGPGAADMKGGLAVALHALEVLEEAGAQVDWTMILNRDEETGSFHSMAALSTVAAEHDIGLAMEPALAGGALAIERMGAGQFRVEVLGRAAHVGRAFEEGISAVTRLAELILEIASMADPAAGRIVSIGPLLGGDATNAVPARALAWGNARFRDQAAADALAASIDAIATQGDALPRVNVDRLWHRPPKPRTAGVDRLATAARDAAESLGQQLPFEATGGVCDGNLLQAAGLPAIDTLGVRGGNLHRTDEFVEIASLAERTALLAVLLSRLAG